MKTKNMTKRIERALDAMIDLQDNFGNKFEEIQRILDMLNILEYKINRDKEDNK